VGALRQEGEQEKKQEKKQEQDRASTCRQSRQKTNPQTEQPTRLQGVAGSGSSRIPAPHPGWMDGSHTIGELGQMLFVNLDKYDL
jgi:hypothetical protein